MYKSIGELSIFMVQSPLASATSWGPSFGNMRFGAILYPNRTMSFILFYEKKFTFPKK
jgi:hypothetical protein